MKTQSVDANPDILYDVLIVGAGVSGLFAATQLLEYDPSLKIIVVEKLNRTGGRLQTTTVPVQGTDGHYYSVKDEEGGMRFCPEGTGMANLWKLINSLYLQPVTFPMGDGNNRYYFRGRSFTKASTPDAWKLLFNLEPSEQNKQPGEVFKAVMDTILKENKKHGRVFNGDVAIPDTPEEWIRFRNTFTYKSEVLHKWGFWALLRTYGLSQECISWLDRAIGFMGPVDEFINAGEGLQIIFDFPGAESFCALPDGYQSLTDALTTKLHRLEGNLVLGETVQAIHEKEEYKIVMGIQSSYRAKKVILALPRKAIEHLAKSSPLLNNNDRFMQAVSSVHNMELTKIGLYFNHRWWHDPAINISSGPSFSDLPAGSVYAFAQFPNNLDEDKKYDQSAALTIYTDFIRGNFWKELQNLGQPYTTNEFPQNPENTTAASTLLVEEAMRQIKLIFGLAPGKHIPNPVLSTYRVWGQGDYGYGYHQYKLNVDDQQVYSAILNPANGIYVCNEAWSPEQGWVEGSLIATAKVLCSGFNLPEYTKSVASFAPVTNLTAINQY